MTIGGLSRCFGFRCLMFYFLMFCCLTFYCLERRNLAKGGLILPGFADQSVDVGNIQIITHIVARRCRRLFWQSCSGFDPGFDPGFAPDFNGGLRHWRSVIRLFETRLAGVFRRSTEARHWNVDDRHVRMLVHAGRDNLIIASIITRLISGDGVGSIILQNVGRAAEPGRQVNTCKRVVWHIGCGFGPGRQF